MVVEERHRKRRLERKQHSRAQCWCVATTTHTRGEDKTRHGNGWTHKGKKDVGHTRGKGREKTRRGSTKDTHHTEKEKKAKRQ